MNFYQEHSAYNLVYPTAARFFDIYELCVNKHWAA